MTDVLILGKGGQVSTALKSFFPKATFLGLPDLDFENENQVVQELEKRKPKLIINAAAFTAVDIAEIQKDDVHGSCYQINAKTPGQIANWCLKNNSILIHFSTDYVFPGTGEKPWTESDTSEPCNWYGKSKWDGDQAILQSKCKSLIFRVSWVYFTEGKNFLLTMLKLGKEKETLKIVNDQVGYPTYAQDIAESIFKIYPVISKPNFHNWGVYHLVGDDTASWYDFAKSIFEISKSDFQGQFQIKNLIPIPTSDYPTPANRPLNSRMNPNKFKKEFGFCLPPWKNSLQKAIGIIYGH